MAQPENRNSLNRMRSEFARIDEHADFVERHGQQFIRSTEWELVRINPTTNYAYADEHHQAYLGATVYVLLKKERVTELLLSDELNITIIPLVWCGNSVVGSRYAHRFSESDWQPSTWGVRADLISHQVKFAHQGNLIIKCKRFRNRGLGSYIFSDFVRWAKEYYLEFSAAYLQITPLDEDTPNGKDRAKVFYRRFGFPVEKVSELKECRNPNKVESVSLEEFLPEIIVENSDAWNDKRDLVRQLERQTKATPYTLCFVVGMGVGAMLLWLFMG